ncbi:hypothetical protein N7501_011178 [Penicillium viridicatum]|nr:hypothetical protein N7501_011178 [Penicillium viridicatum]
MEALAVALKAGYIKPIFSHILNYGMHLNVQILEYDQKPYELDIIPDVWSKITLTPLEWAVEHRRLDLVNLFLDNGADANHTIYEGHGPALFKAVKHRHHRMVEVLMQIRDRISYTISCTRRLALVVEQLNTTTAKILLGHSVSCDFEESDRPCPPDPISWDDDSLLWRGLESEDITPPLVRASRLNECNSRSIAD